MASSLFKFFLFAIIVQCSHSSGAAKNNSNPSKSFLNDIMKEHQAESNIEKQQLQQRGPATYLDKAKTSASKGLESEATPSKVAKKVAKLTINEATTAVEDLNRAEGSKKELNKGKGKVEDDKYRYKDTEVDLDDISHVSVQHRDGNFHSADLILPLNMQLDNSFNGLIITEESLPEVQIKITKLEDTIGSRHVGQIGKNKGRGKGKNKKQPPMVKRRGDLIGSGSAGKDNENENDAFDYNSFETPIILTHLQFRQFTVAFEPFIAGQEKLLEKELNKINDGEILHKSVKELLSGMTEGRKYEGEWHKKVRKVLVTIMGGTLKFWRENVAQILSKEPSTIYHFYDTMTAIFLGPKEGRCAEAKKIIPRVNEVTSLVYKGIRMHNKKSADLFKDAVKEFKEKILNFEPEFDRIRTNNNLEITKKKEQITEALQPVTRFYKQNFVDVEKFNEYFHVALLMVNKVPKDGLKFYSRWMRLVDEQSAQIIRQSMMVLFHNQECGDFKADAMKVFSAYFDKAKRFPSALDLFEMGVARNGLAPFAVEIKTDTNT